LRKKKRTREPVVKIVHTFVIVVLFGVAAMAGTYALVQSTSHGQSSRSRRGKAPRGREPPSARAAETAEPDAAAAGGADVGHTRHHHRDRSGEHQQRQ
jgi:hypothetical protein